MRRRRFALVTSLFPTLMLTHRMANSSEEVLHPPSRLKFSLGVSEEMSVGHARVRVTVLGNGAQRIYPGSRLMVNGVPLQEVPHSKQGVWYQAEVPLAPGYDVTFTTSEGQSLLEHRVIARTFSAHVPETITLAQDLKIPFVLTPAHPGDAISLEFRPDRPMGDLRALRVDPRVEEGQLIVPAVEISRLPPGPVALLVGLYGANSRQGAVDTRYAVLHRTTIRVEK